MDKLYFLTGPLQGGTAELIGEEITIGRAPDNGICLDDDSVSDHHAVIIRKNRECILRDLQTAKGTTVRGEKIIVATLLDSDRVKFGSIEAEFTTTEIKLQMPKTAVLPSSHEATWPQPKQNRPPQTSALKTAVGTLLQLAVVGALAVGAYFAYQKLKNVDPLGDVPAAETAKTAPQPAPVTRAQPPHYTAAAELPPTPEPYKIPASATPPAEPPAASPVPAPAAPTVAPVVKVAAPMTTPEIQQAQLLMVQGKFPEASAALDKVIATTKDPAVAVAAQLPLKQALDAQIRSLQSTKQQWEVQCKAVEERLKAAQDQLTQDTKALEKKKADEDRIYTTSGGRWFNGRWIANTRKGTGDSSAQSVIQGLQIKVMTDSQEVKKQADLIARYQPQIIAFDQQIAGIQARVAQMDASTKPLVSSQTRPVQETVQAAPVMPEPAPVPTPVPATPAAAPPEPAPASVELDQLKPEDWVRSLPTQAQSAYLVGFSQRGTARVDRLRHWLSLWSKHMVDPNLTLLELDYIKQMVQYRDPSLDRALAEARKGQDRISKSEWGNIQQQITRKMSDLTSAGNKLMAMNVRSGNQPKLATMISETTDHVTQERAEMLEIVEHYKSVCSRHRWRYSWYW